jgi:hypothetical protein
VNARWTAKLRALSLDHLYMTDARPTEPIPAHPVWHAPLVLARPDEPFDQLEARIARAGSLWLVNYDFRPFNELVIAHARRPWVMVFQRAERPDEGHIEAGPFESRIAGDATPLPRVPFVYVENAHATRREAWRQLATRPPA